MIEFASESKRARIKVIGIGGGGGNAVNSMVKCQQIGGVDFIVANTDIQALGRSQADCRVQIGESLTRGLGAGSDPEKGKMAASDDIEKVKAYLIDSDMIFITAGMGGGTGTGAAPVIAKAAKDSGALTVGIVTKPFLFEGKRRMKIADQGIEELKDAVDSLIVIPNQRLLGISGRDIALLDAFKMADDVLRQAVQGLSDIIMKSGYINVDFADVRTVMSNMGRAIMGTGMASGEGKTIMAIQSAISSPLLEEGSIEGARGVLVNITGGPDLSLHEINEASSIINENITEDALLIIGHVVDNDMEDEVKVTVIATGFEKERQQSSSGFDIRPELLDMSGMSGSDEGNVTPIDGDNRNIPAFIRLKNQKREVPSRSEVKSSLSFRKDDLDVPAFLRRKAD